jgi:hypothetical protein
MTSFREPFHTHLWSLLSMLELQGCGSLKCCNAIGFGNVHCILLLGSSDQIKSVHTSY